MPTLGPGHLAASLGDMETGRGADEPREPATQSGPMHHPQLRDGDRTGRNDSQRAQLAHIALPEIPGWLDEQEADQPRD
jgi:hypothetical protein